jgi:FkbM family methyltransferase
MTCVDRPIRRTGTWTDGLRVAWRRLVGRNWPRIDHAAHRVYFHMQRVVAAVRLMSDARSVVAYLRVESRFAGREPVAVRVRPLDRRTVWLRPGTTDAESLRDTFRDGVHVPPPSLRRPLRRIVDLGANIGITAAHNALLHPHATILAIELDPDNAAIARRNTSWAEERVVVREAAVWPTDGIVVYSREAGHEFGFRVLEETADASATPAARALSMATVLADVPEDERVDFVKMDIEGVEASLFSGETARWTARVDAIALQVHDPYSLADCARDLRALGFSPRVEPRRTNFIVAVREPS